MRGLVLALVAAVLLAAPVHALPVQTPHHLRAVDLDGSSYLTRGAGLTGAVDGKKGTVSVWFRIDGGNNTVRAIFEGTSGRTTVNMNASNQFEIFARNAASTNILVLTSTSTYLAGATWHHAVASWDLAAGLGHLYIDDVDVLVATPTTNDTIDYTLTNWAVGAQVSAGGAKWNGCLAQLFVDISNYTDLSVTANRREFVRDGVLPADLGANGERPFGSPPIVFEPMIAGKSYHNSGTGGSFTIKAGTLPDCDRLP